MGMDVDYIAAKQAIEELNDLLLNLKHGNRSNLCDDIEEFVEKMKDKYQ